MNRNEDIPGSETEQKMSDSELIDNFCQKGEYRDAVHNSNGNIEAIKKIRELFSSEPEILTRRAQEEIRKQNQGDEVLESDPDMRFWELRLAQSIVKELWRDPS